MTESVEDPSRVAERLRTFAAGRRVRGAGSVVLAVSAALLNGALASVWFPSMTVLDSRTVNTIVALCAGIVIGLAGRFPLWLLAAQGAAAFAVAVLPSLAVAALIAGVRRGVKPWPSWTVAVLAAASLALATWMPPNGRLLAPLIVLLPYGVGALIHAISEQRRTDQQRIILLLKNISLREEQSALQERQRIADELHDRLGHQLTAIEIQTRLLLEDSADAGPAAKRAAIVHDAAARAIDEVHSIVREEPVASFAQDLASTPTSLAQQVQDMAHTLDVPLTCAVGPGVSELPFDVEYALLRVAEEALTNAARHATGQRVVLRVDRTDASATLTISNPITDASTRGTGRGIPSLANRVRLLGGMLSANVDDNSRFVLEVSLPLGPAGDDL